MTLPQSDSLDCGDRTTAPAEAGLLGRFVGSLAGWLPPLAAFGLFCHLCLLGLAPARVERERLETAEARLAAERLQLELRVQELKRLRRAQQDPVYIERVRRLELAGPPTEAVPASDEAAR